MPTPILVVYATRYGSTQEVAEAIAATLREYELEVDVRPARDVSTLEGYQAVVLGAPLYGRWHADADHFLSRHHVALMERPVAIFALGPLHSSANEQEWQGARAQLDTVLLKFPWLTPVAIELFGGKFDPKQLHLPDKLIVALPASPLHHMPPSDVRDWTVIRAWASSLAAMLQPALQH